VLIKTGFRQEFFTARTDFEINLPFSAKRTLPAFNGLNHEEAIASLTPDDV